MQPGVKMKAIWLAIALAAAGLTPAAAQTPASQPTTAAATTATPPAGTAQDATKPDAAQPPIVYGSVGHAIPTPGIGEPDGRKGIQYQVTPIGREAEAFHDGPLMIYRGGDQHLRAAVAAVRDGALPPKQEPGAVAQFAQYADRGHLDGGPGVHPRRDRDPLDHLLAHQYSPPPADVTVKVTGHQWYWSYELPDYGVSFDSYMLKEAGDPTRQKNQRARTDNDGPPLLAVDERLVIPQGKTVKFIVTADDVIHSFAVPAFWIKQDANPGQLHETWVKVDRPGVYFGQCSELCGARHGYMPIGVEVTSPARFAAVGRGEGRASAWRTAGSRAGGDHGNARSRRARGPAARRQPVRDRAELSEESLSQ